MCIDLAHMQRTGSQRMHILVENMLCNKGQGLNNQSINFTVPKQH